MNNLEIRILCLREVSSKKKKEKITFTTKDFGVLTIAVKRGSNWKFVSFVPETRKVILNGEIQRDFRLFAILRLKRKKSRSIKSTIFGRLEKRRWQTRDAGERL